MDEKHEHDAAGCLDCDCDAAPWSSNTPCTCGTAGKAHHCPRSWPENSEPTPPQLAEWLVTACSDCRLRVAEAAISDRRHVVSCFLGQRPHHWMNADGTCHAGDMFVSGLSDDERHWRTAMISERERPQWIAVDAALRPYLGCEPKDHHPSCCPAVIAVMEALGLHEAGVFQGTPNEMFGPLSPDLEERYERTLRQIEEAER